MKIVETELHEIAIPLKEPFIISGGAITERRSLIVVLRDDEGREGFGEAPAFELPFYSEETLGTARHTLTEVLLRFASQFSLHHCKVLSITSHEHSRLAKLADFNLSWHVPQTRIAGVYDITTQIPVIYIRESLGRKLAKKLTE